MTAVAIVADDLTGAADSAALFAQAGLATLLPLRDAPLPDADVLSCSTESRDLPPAEAAVATGNAVRRALAAAGERPCLIYKKLDSALRGQLAAELDAAMRAAGADRAVVAPALPAEGRTTRHGYQLVHGKRLEETAFGGPGVTGDLLALLNGCGERPARAVPLDVVRGEPARLRTTFAQPGAIFVVDAEREDDLDRIAAAALDAGAPLLAGSAGLARACVRVGRFEPAHAPPPWTPAGSRPVLCIAGTRHEATARQVARAEQAGIAVFRPRQEDLDDADGGMGWLIEAVERELGAGQDAVVTTAGLAPCVRGSGAVVERLSRLAASPAIQAAVGGLFLTGGDVAAGVCATLGADAIWLLGEVRPAIPWGALAGGVSAGTPVVTKAGSFGGDETLLICLEHLKATRAGSAPGVEPSPLAR